MASCRSARQSHTPWSCSQRWRPSRSSKTSSRLPLLPSPPPCRPVALPLPRSMAESRMAMGGVEGASRQRRRREESARKRDPVVIELKRRAVQCWWSRLLHLGAWAAPRHLVRRRGLRLQATTGCFLQNQRRRDELRRRVVRALIWPLPFLSFLLARLIPSSSSI